MDRGLWHCTGDRDQDHLQEREVQKSKMAIWGGLTNSCEKKRSEKQRRKGEIRKPLSAINSKKYRKNKMGKTRDLFNKIRDTKGTFHAKMSSINNKNGMGLIEAEDIKKRWQEYTEKLHKKDLHDPDNHDDVITHLEPDILEYEVKCTLGSTMMSKTGGSDGIPVELFQS